ncbi:methylmalonyl-CoA mutase family protein [Williamsia sterculiae]|uniref:Heterodimeric methylmalonyl-CoA mutase small subunit n=1 Tax=Williamsia sterculiae TaxID=1344003 RepID=A0A1N7EL35_9NOCA|nr:methylmalonyl-CoA mutase family protein [Williamsia sterculiae]SIR88797.1 heterodimeric methylmalonyl-CoA mutase small subunit [Williamsia sterculiae]
MPDDPTPQDAYERWSEAAAAVLAKGRRIEVGELPDTAEALLSYTQAGGLIVRPLYTRRDELPEPPVPGVFPYVRGSDGARDVVMGWRVTERFGDPDGARDAESVNTALLAALENGASGIWLAVGESGVDVADLSTVLNGVLFDLVPLTLDAGASGVEAADALLDLLPADHRQTPATTVSLGLAPLSSAFSGRPAVSVDDAVAVAGRAGTRARALRVDGTDFVAGGASDVQEVAFAVAAGVDLLRALTDSGLTAADALAQISFGITTTADQFLAIAKFRALRRMWARVAQVAGAPEAGAAISHAVTSLGMYTQRDPWVNMLRSTIAAFGAGVGGADQVTVLGFDAALPVSARTTSPGFSRRMARNTQLLLLEESNLGKVLDPAGGSWFVEALTDDFATAAWSLFQTVEAAGGYRAALGSGLVAEQVTASLAERDDAVAHRTVPITGVSEFPNLDEKPITTDSSAPGQTAPEATTTDGIPTATPNLVRVAHAFETLRDRSDATLADTGSRPTVLLIPVGPIAEHNARTTFVANLLAAGGIAVSNPGPLDPPMVADAVRAAGSPRVAVICAANGRYRSDGSAAIAAARDAGVPTVLIAGPSSAWPADAPAPDGFVGLGDDAVTLLTDLHEQIDPEQTDRDTTAAAGRASR